MKYKIEELLCSSHSGDDYSEEFGNKYPICKLKEALKSLYSLVSHETDLPSSAANGVESSGLDEGVVRASLIIEETRQILGERCQNDS